MFGRYLAFVAGIAVLVVVFAPREGNPLADLAAPDAVEEKAAMNVVTTDAPDTVQWNTGGHTLDRQSDGHFYADAMVEGASVRMMVDTGASVIALTGADASAAGLDWDDSEIGEIGSGASGAVEGVRTRLSEVEIGGIVRRNVPAVIIPEGLEVSLLGQSWLSKVEAVEIEGDRMVLNAD